MKISLDEVRKVAELAKLNFSAAELKMMAADLDRIVEYVEKLEELDVRDVPETSYVMEWQAALREDRVQPGLSNEDALKNAPARQDGFFSVPKVNG